MSESENLHFTTILRVVTVVCGVGLSILGVFQFITFDITNARQFILSLYYILFGILVCLSEMSCEKLMSCFYFLKFYLGKGLFFIFLASITFD